ncbi:multidrug MFS transporter [Planococcus rifietoensis]|uniref:Multidrug MFS transporter n=1 Tax=Planococcus rifietoensis TaxID=200991 RepID=A0A0U2ZAB0_9BACL|nr:MFS transporter [Planococcus rifietoensis]ALS74069.1 multidrug MFS transporter [Planococcus rifietoensis]
MNHLQQKLWTKDFIILSLINFFLIFVYLLLNATIALYALQEWNATTGQAGLVAGIFIIGALAGRLLTGSIIEKVGYKSLLIVGLIFFTATILLYFVNFGLAFFMVSRFLNGVTLGVATTVIGTLVVLTIPESKRGEGIGYFSVSTAMATGLGPFTGLYMTQHTEFVMIFLFCLVLGIVSTLVGFFITVPKIEKTEVEPTRKGCKLSDLIEPKAIPISFIVLIMTFCFSSVLSFINLYAIELNLVDTASFFFIVYTISVLISRPFSGRLMDSIGPNYVIYPAFFMFGVGMILLSTANSSGTLLAAAALIGLGFGNISSISQTIAVTVAAPHRMGLATATFFIFFDIGNGFGPSLLGIVIPVIGFPATYAILGFAVLAMPFLYYVLHGKEEKKARMNLIDNK